MHVQRESVVFLFPRDQRGHDVLLITGGIDGLFREECTVDGHDIIVFRIVFDELAVNDCKIRPVVGNVVFQIAVVCFTHVRLMIHMNFTFVFLVESGDHTIEHSEVGTRDRRPEFKRNRSGRRLAAVVAPAATGTAAERSRC